MTYTSQYGEGYKIFLTNLGFDESPFTYTNADEEDRLHDYFIDPPYFHTVFGDPNHPKSFVVFAPRGGGKTAQRIMIEYHCAKNNVLAVTYDQFEFPGVKQLSELGLQHHLQNMLRCILMGVFATLHTSPDKERVLERHDKDILVKLSTEYFSGLTAASIKKTLDTLKSFKDKAREIWNEWIPFLGTGMALLTKRILGTETPDLSKFDFSQIDRPSYLKYELELLVTIALKLGYKSVYVLIDRVDESEFTGTDPNASFKLIEPLLRDLDILEFKGLGIKFFLWDQIEPLYLPIARKDRVPQESLTWDEDMLSKMWAKRLRAYSRGRVPGLNNVSMNTAMPYSTDELALIFANGSPRDMIRIGHQIFSEQLQTDPFARSINPEAVYQAIEKFCETRATEVASTRAMNNFRKIQRVDFTIPYLANNVFREQQPNTRSRMVIWRRESSIIDIDRVDHPDPNTSRQQVKLMGIGDIRVAKVMFPSLDIPTFLKQKYRKCPQCGTTILREWGDRFSSSICHACQYDLSQGQHSDAQNKWRHEQLAAQYRSRQRKAAIEAQQLSLDFKDPDEVDDIDDIQDNSSQDE